MAVVRDRKPLCQCERRYFKSEQGIEERSLFQRVEALQNIVREYISPVYQHYLAHPVIDGDTMEWHAVEYRDKPQVLNELGAEEKSRYMAIHERTKAHYKDVIGQLKGASKNEEAEYLEKAIKFINDDFLYCYDDKVVLGIWGMQLRGNVIEPIGEIRKHIYNWRGPRIATPVPAPPVEPEVNTEDSEPEQEITPPKMVSVHFAGGDHGQVQGRARIFKEVNSSVESADIPQVHPKTGYRFLGWDRNPVNHVATDDITFTALYEASAPMMPWYTRLWNWLLGIFSGWGCLRWLLLLLLLLLLFWLLWWFFHKQNSGHAEPVPLPDSVSNREWVRTDPRAGGGGIYDPGSPYTPVPTPPEYADVLPPQQGVLPPIDNPELVREPGKPVLVANKLNILMENEDISIMELGKDFKAKYPDEKYKVVYYDDVVKRMQIEVPAEERESLKGKLPAEFAPKFSLFVFDETLFEAEYMPSDPGFGDANKAWYLKKVGAPAAWDISSGKKEVTIAIVDNGFNLEHPEFLGKVVMPYNVWLHSSEVFAQDQDHGTHVAGTALALADNAQGLCGVAPKCSFMPVQVADERGLMTISSVLDGVLYALYQGADVVNLSLGCMFEQMENFPESYQKDLIQNHFKEEERLWREVSRIAEKHRAVVVLAAGNQNVLAGIDALQRPQNFIVVSAVDKKQNSISKAPFSNFGEFATISAPGVDIYNALGSNGYKALEGTSMAAPIVSGAVALMKSLNDTIGADKIICLLQKTGLEANGSIGKLVQVDKALQALKAGQFTDCAAPIPVPTSGEVQILLSWNNTNDLDILCTDPSEKTVFFRNKSVPSGGQLEIDMNATTPLSRSPIEHIFWPTGRAPSGTYNVYLLFYRKHEPSIDQTPYKISVKYGQKHQVYTGTIGSRDSVVHICTFNLGEGSSSALVPDNRGNQRKGSLLQERERLRQELERIERELGAIGNSEGK